MPRRAKSDFNVQYHMQKSTCHEENISTRMSCVLRVLVVSGSLETLHVT